MRLWPWCWRQWRISAQVLELALCQVHRQVSEPPLELRAPLVRQLLQVAEPAPPRPFEPAARAPRAARPP